MMTVSTEGDIGDTIFLLGILAELPHGPHTLLLQASTTTKTRGPEGLQRFHDAIAPLSNAQPYVSECRTIEPEDTVYWRSAEFRRQHYTMGETLMQAHLNHLIATKGIGHGIKGDQPWITATPSAETKGKVVVNRTGRYRNEWFKWHEVVKKYRHDVVFIGLQHEWKEFIGHFGYVEFRPTSSMLEVAELIAGSELFIGNQSCCNAIAEGLKHNSIQESSLDFPDCIWGRPNAQHSYNGSMILPGLNGDVDTIVPAYDPVRQIRSMHTDMAPPGGWQHELFNGQRSFGYDQAEHWLKATPEFMGRPKEEIRHALLSNALQRNPTWQAPTAGDPTRIIMALDSAKSIRAASKPPLTETTAPFVTCH